MLKFKAYLKQININKILPLTLRDFHIVKLFSTSFTPNFYYCTEYINTKKGFLTSRKSRAS